MRHTLSTLLGLVFFAAGHSKLLLAPPRSTATRHTLQRRRPWKALGGFELALGLALVFGAHPSALVMAVVFLLIATGSLALDLASPQHRPCNCFGAHTHTKRRASRTEPIRSTLQPAWFFARNGALVALAGAALGWSPARITAALAIAWALIAAGTTASLVRLHRVSRSTHPTRHDVARAIAGIEPSLT